MLFPFAAGLLREDGIKTLREQGLHLGAKLIGSKTPVT